MWLTLLGFAKWFGGHLLSFLNAKVDADARVEIATVGATADVAKAGLSVISKADELNARLREGAGPWAIFAVVAASLVLAPLVWHEWQVVLDSSRWLPVVGTWYGIPYVTVVWHDVGSWKVPKLPGAWDAIELSIFQSFFIGAAAATAAIATIKAFRK